MGDPMVPPRAPSFTAPSVRDSGGAPAGPSPAPPPSDASHSNKLGSSSVTGEVLRILIAAGLLLADLHQHVVQERRGAEAEAVRRQPVGAERLVHDHEVLDGLLRSADPARRLHPDDT